MLPSALENLIAELGKLPGIGPRSAERLAFYILKSDKNGAKELSDSLVQLHHQVHSCENCFNLSEEKLCRICQNPNRDTSVIAVVEEPFDVIALEKTSLYKGLYHVLGGVISPIDGIGPNQLTIEQLSGRIKQSKINEIILALNPSTEGEATALYIQKRLPRGIKITRLARGLPMGSDLEYADQITLGRALEGRQAF